MNSENSKISDPHILLLNLSDKINLKGSDKYVALSNLSIYYTWKIIKKSYKNNKFKISLQYGMKNLNYRMDKILIIQDYFEYILKNHDTVTDNSSIRICVNKTENRITFKRKTEYYLELLTPETMKILGNTKSKITKDVNGENVPHSEITEVVLMHCNIVNNDYQQDSRVLYTFVPNKSFGELLDISPKSFIFLKTLNSEF